MDTKEEKINNEEYHDVRIITYNVLSVPYATEKYFPRVWKNHLSFEYRKVKMLKLFTSWIKVNFIICLQEVSEEWDVVFTEFFAKTGYVYKSALYRNGELGVAVVFPSNHFTLLDENVHVCGELIQDRYETIQRKLKDDENDENKLSKFVNPSILTELSNASESKNAMLTLLLSAKYHGKSVNKNIIVSTYHMPCRYAHRYFMAAHIYAFKHTLKKLMSEWNEKYGNVKSTIIGGDYNIIPSGPDYKLLVGLDYTEQELNKFAAFVTNIKKIFKAIGTDFDDQLQVRSAYLAYHGTEPTYTNVCIQPGKQFVDCLDYILINDAIEIRSAQVGLATEDPIKIPYPNGLSPSDHLPVSASLRVL